MNEQIGESPQGPIAPRPDRRRPNPRRRGGQRRPRDNREPMSNTPPMVAPESSNSGEPSAVPLPAVETTAFPAQRPPAQIQQRPPHSRPPQPHHPRIPGSPIVLAIEQVEDVVRTLKESLRELEEVLEILDDAQRQQIGDEKEIDTLRRSLSALQRARDSVRREQPRDPSRNESDEQRPSTGPRGE